MDLLEDSCMIFLRRVATFVGLWPLQAPEDRFLRNCVVGFSLMYGILMQLHQLLTLDFNLGSIILALQLFLPFACITNLYYTCMLNFDHIKDLSLWLIEDWWLLKDEMEIKITQTYMEETKLFLKFCGSMFSVYISFCILPPILHIFSSTSDVADSLNRYPLYFCFRSYLNKEYYYYFIVVYQIFTVVLMTLVGIMVLFSYARYIQHVCTRLSIVKYKLRKPFLNSNPNDEVLATPKDLSYWMIDITQHLARTVNFMTSVNRQSENCYLFQVSMAFFVLILNILCLFQIPSLLKDRNNLKDVFTYLSFLIGTCIPTYTNCFLGQRVINCSTEVFREMCLVPFHEISLNTQELLLINLMMNSKPCSISIGKMFISSHEFFSDLLRSALSFAMVLHSTQNA